MGARELTVLLLMCTVWGFHFIVIKVAVSEIPPMFYAAIRMTLVAAIMSPFLRWRPQASARGLGAMTRVLIAGVCMGGLNYAFMFTGLKHATASAAAMALELYVPFATMLSVLLLGEHIGWRRLTGIALAFAGVALIAFGASDDNGNNAGADIRLGIGLVAAGAMVEAFGTILVKQSPGFKPLELLAWFSLVGAIVLWGLTFALEDGQGSAFAKADKALISGAILYSALGGSVFGHTAYYWLLQRLPVSTVAPSVLLTTLLAVTFGVVLLDDPFGPRFIIGGLMTLAGVGVVLMRVPGRVTQPGSPMPLAPAAAAMTEKAERRAGDDPAERIGRR